MDGFYDQQVPFVVPESVSLHLYIFIRFVVLCEGDRGLRLQFVVIKTVLSSLSNFQRCHVEEAERCLSDRKRKFMDTELAQDTEGRFIMASRPHVKVFTVFICAQWLFTAVKCISEKSSWRDKTIRISIFFFLQKKVINVVIL